MVIHTFRVTLLPNPPLGFEPETAVWREIDVDGSHTLAEFHDAIFDAFDRWDAHTYEFLARNEAGIAVQSYVSPGLYEGGQSWPPMPAEEIERFIEHAAPEDASAADVERFREVRSNPPPEQNAAETTIGEVDPESRGSLFYEFDMGDGWEHHIELVGTREGTVDGGPAIVDRQGDAPPQYPDRGD
ncbi:MAG: hypothetical protein V5A43_07460 [Haloarculaceae archaeon]